MNTLELATKRVALRKASSTNGGEWQGPCPSCGGTDRFHVWPEQNEGRGGYWCRGCGKIGDNIQFLRDFEGLSFRDACARLNISIPERPSSRRPGTPPAARPTFVPEQRIPPEDLWQEKAGKLIAWAEGNLFPLAEAPIGVLSWLADRGISNESARRYRLGWNPGENGNDLFRPRKVWGLPEALKEDGRPRALWIPRGLVIPYIVDGIVYRIRIRRPQGEPRYYVLPGSSMATMLLGRDRRAFIVIESELDAIACVEAQSTAGAAALGSVAAKPDFDSYAVLQGSLQILNALDYDAAGAKAMEWWEDHFDRCDRWPVPQGKDPGEAFKLGTDLKTWIEAGLPPALTIGNDRDAYYGAYIPPGPLRDVPPLASVAKNIDKSEPVTSLDYPPPILELWGLLKKNPGVKIVNTPARYTVLRNGKYVGGRINELVFRTPEVTDYLSAHPAEEIDGKNLIIGEAKQ